MDGSAKDEWPGSGPGVAASPRRRLGSLRRRSFLGGLVGLALVRSHRAGAVQPSTYGHGYRGGYR